MTGHPARQLARMAADAAGELRGYTDPAEARRLEQLGYRSLLMFALAVEDEPYALIEIYDTRPRSFGGVEVRLCRALTAEAMAGRFHGNDERVDVASLALTTQAWLDTCEQFLG